jgi:hypothetical protein
MSPAHEFSINSACSIQFPILICIFLPLPNIINAAVLILRAPVNKLIHKNYIFNWTFLDFSPLHVIFDEISHNIGHHFKIVAAYISWSASLSTEVRILTPGY